MPAYPTHSFFSHLALQALLEAKHPWAAMADSHASLFRVAGIAGADIQCMPYQICGNCQSPYRHDQKSNQICLVCGKAALRDFEFQVSDGRRLTRRDVERDLYGNTHLVLYRTYRGYGVAPEKLKQRHSPEQPFPDQVVAHLANCLRDAEKVGGKHVEYYIAFILGWFSHVVSDAVFKGVYPHAAKVDFFGHQYDMRMLPAAEMLTMTDLAYDFGVHWPTWHKELLRLEPDGGALKHLAMGDSPDSYDSRYWTGDFGKPDPAIGRVLDALPPINRRWFHRMYTQPDYSAATPVQDRVSFSERASARFGGGLDLGKLRRYAKGSGWYESFIKGIQIYLRVVQEASERAGISDGKAAPTMPSTIPRFSLWSAVVAEANAEQHEWGSKLELDPDAPGWIRTARAHAVSIEPGKDATDYQQRLAQLVRAKVRNGQKGQRASRRVLIGSPAFNARTTSLCIEDALRLKYDKGLAGLAKVKDDTLLLAGFSDFGDQKLSEWLQEA
jgi:hypothetical protein